MIATTGTTALLSVALGEALADPTDPSPLAAVADLIEDGAGLVAGDFADLLVASFAARLARRTPVVVHRWNGVGRPASSVTWRHSPRLFGVFEARPLRGLAFSWQGQGEGRLLPVVDATSSATRAPRWHDAGDYDALRALRHGAEPLCRAGGGWGSWHVLPCLPAEVLAAGAELAAAVVGAAKSPAPVDRSRWAKRPGSLGGWSSVQHRSLMPVAIAVEPGAEEVRVLYDGVPAAAEVTSAGRYASPLLEDGDPDALLGWRPTTPAELLAADRWHEGGIAADWGYRL